MQRKTWLIPTLVLALAAGACKDKAADSTLTKDSALSRDLALANKDTTSQPQLRDVPTPAPAPVTPAPAPRTVPPRPRPRPATNPPAATHTPAPTTPTVTRSGNTVERGTRGSEGSLATIAAGTSINLASTQRVCTNTFKPGDRFTADVSESVSGTNGAMIPAGAKAVLQVTSVKRSDNSNDKGELGLSVLSISMNGKSFPVDAAITSVPSMESVRTSTKGDDAKKVIGGAIIGAIAGQIIGHSTKGTVIGAATGAAAGAGAAAVTGNYEFCLPSGGRFTIKLNAPATITTSN